MSKKEIDLKKITTRRFGVIELAWEGDKFIGLCVWRFAYSKLTGFVFL